MIGHKNPLETVRQALDIARIGVFNNELVQCFYGPGGYLKVYYGTPSRCLLWAKVDLPIMASREPLKQKSIQTILARPHSIHVQKLFEISKHLSS